MKLEPGKWYRYKSYPHTGLDYDVLFVGRDMAGMAICQRVHANSTSEMRGYADCCLHELPRKPREITVYESSNDGLCWVEVRQHEHLRYRHHRTVRYREVLDDTDT